MLAVITAAEAGALHLVSSDVLRFETENSPLPYRRDFGRRVLRLALVDTATTAGVSSRARDFELTGIKPLDAVHLASAVEADADYFCSVDDALLKKAARANTGRTRVVSLLDLIAALQT